MPRQSNFPPQPPGTLWDSQTGTWVPRFKNKEEEAWVKGGPSYRPDVREDSDRPPYDFQTPTDREEEHRTGAILRQREIFASSPHVAYDGHGKTDTELPPWRNNNPPKAVSGPSVHRQEGLYGEDEDHPYDVYVTDNGRGDGGYDVLGGPLPPRGKKHAGVPDFGPGSWVHPDEVEDDEGEYDDDKGHWVRK